MVVFSGSLMNGLNEDPITWCGFASLTDEERDLLWGEISEHDLREQCSAAEICFFDDDEEPGYSDDYYEVHCEDEQQLKAELKAVIANLLGSSGAS